MQKGFAPILIVFLIAVLGIGGYFVYRNYSNNLSNQTKPFSTPVVTTQTPQPTPVSSPSAETANWKIYTNEKYGFKFGYPLNLDIKSDSSIITLNSKDSKNNPLITLIILDNPNYFSLKDFEEKNTGESGMGPNVYYKNAETIKVLSGINVYRVEKETSCFGKCESYVWSNKNVIYKLINWQNSPLGKQILSTFKFTQ